MAFLAALGPIISAAGSAMGSAGMISSTAATVMSVGGTALGAVGGMIGASQQADAASDQGAYATKVARMEAESQRIDDRYAAARARVRQYSGVSLSSGSPLFDDLENARRIQQRYSDRIFQGRVSAMESRSQAGALMSEGFAGLGSAGGSIASMLFRKLMPSGAPSFPAPPSMNIA